MRSTEEACGCDHPVMRTSHASSPSMSTVAEPASAGTKPVPRPGTTMLSASGWLHPCQKAPLTSPGVAGPADLEAHTGIRLCAPRGVAQGFHALRRHDLPYRVVGVRRGSLTSRRDGPPRAPRRRASRRTSRRSGPPAPGWRGSASRRLPHLSNTRHRRPLLGPWPGGEGFASPAGVGTPTPRRCRAR